MKYYQIFGRRSCPWCLKACEALKEAKLDFMFCDMEESPALQQYFKDTYNTKTVPIVVETDLFSEMEYVVGGCTDLIEYLENQNDES